MSDCVFCSRINQPETLFETASLYAMSDKFPVLPGHLLIISRAHLRCYADAPEAVVQELAVAATRLRRFLREAYGTEALLWENGVCGQTVFHAHLHLLPVSTQRLPPCLDEGPDITRIDDWDAVRDHFTRRGGYHSVELGGQRRLIAGNSPVLEATRQWLAQVTGLRHEAGDWVRLATEDDIREVARRWTTWADRVREAEPASGGNLYAGGDER
jgi:histidine triad (HIT) family protein